jgi:glycosyltransferase involved in cell wall biosynthesis
MGLGLTSTSTIVPDTNEASVTRRPKLLFLVTEDWYFVSHRLELAVAAKQAGYDVAVATRVGSFGERITDAGIKLCPVAFNRGGLNPFEEIRTLLKIARIYWRETPDIVHHVALKPVIYGSLVARALGIRGVVNALGGLGYIFSSRDLRAKILRWIIKPLLRVAFSGAGARVIVQNRDDRTRLVDDLSVKAESISLIRGAGVNPKAYRRVVTANEMPLSILPARLLREKGVVEFVEAARLLRARGVKGRFALVGKPDPANPTSLKQSEIDAWVREGIVEYWGWRDDMPEVFSQAQIVCLPTYYGEGLPKSLLEAAASGCAIVSSDDAGCLELVEPGVTGWLVPKKDVVALANALQEAIERPDLRQQYGMAAHELIEPNFSMDHVAGATIAIYDQLSARGSPGG